jgi:hypothetical protein
MEGDQLSRSTDGQQHHIDMDTETAAETKSDTVDGGEPERKWLRSSHRRRWTMRDVKLHRALQSAPSSSLSTRCTPFLLRHPQPSFTRRHKALVHAVPAARTGSVETCSLTLQVGTPGISCAHGIIVTAWFASYCMTPFIPASSPTHVYASSTQYTHRLVLPPCLSHVQYPNDTGWTWILRIEWTGHGSNQVWLEIRVDIYVLDLDSDPLPGLDLPIWVWTTYIVYDDCTPSLAVSTFVNMVVYLELCWYMVKARILVTTKFYLFWWKMY